MAVLVYYRNYSIFYDVVTKDTACARMGVSLVRRCDWLFYPPVVSRVPALEASA